MRQTGTITIEHVTVTTNKPSADVREALEEKMVMADVLKHLETTNATYEQKRQAIEELLGKRHFFVFCIIEHGDLLSLAGNPGKAVQYTIGNPLLAIQMTQHVLAVCLYAPFKLAVYEYDNGRTVISYDRLSSFVAQFNNEEATRMAQHVDALLEDLLATVV